MKKVRASKGRAKTVNVIGVNQFQRNGFYLFPLSRAVNSNRLIFDPSEVEIRQ